MGFSSEKVRPSDMEAGRSGPRKRRGAGRGRNRPPDRRTALGGGGGARASHVSPSSAHGVGARDEEGSARLGGPRHEAAPWSGVGFVEREREREREREVVGADPRGTDGRRPAPSLPRGVVCTHMHERFSEGGNADFCRFVLICRDPSQQMIYHSPSLLWVCPNHGRKSHQSHYIPTTTASRVHIEYIIPPSTSCHVLCRTLASLVVRAYIAVFHNACYDVIDTNMHVYRNILTATRHERRQVLYSYGSCLKPAGAAGHF